MDLNNIGTALFIVIHIFAIERFMRVFFEKRRTSSTVFLLSCSLYIIAQFIRHFGGLNMSFPLGSYAMGAIVQLPIFFVIALNYDSSTLKRIVASVYAFITFEAIITFIGNFVINNIPRVEFISTMVAMRFISAILFYLTSIILFKCFKYIKKADYDFPAFSGLALIIGISTLIVGLHNSNAISRIIYFYLNTVLLVISTFLVFYLYNALSKAHEEKLKTALHMQEREYYFAQSKLMQESVKKVRSIRHDMNLHLAAIKDFAKDNKVITDYIDGLLGNIDESEVYSSTGNIAFDSIINFKLKNAAEGNIKLDLSLFIPAVVNIEIADIVIILGNLLDNALTAVAKVEDKVIKLDIEFSKGNLFIKIDNTFDGSVKYAEGEEKRIVTLKSGEEHGHGLNNIRKSVEKYNGHIDITHDNNVFSVGVLLYVDVV
jgi:signal transduction histidine kinase